MIVRGVSASHNDSHEIGDERRYLRTVNKKLSTTNDMMRETMKARTTSMIQQRHKTTFGNMQEKKRLDAILERVQTQAAYQKYNQVNNKELYSNIRQNEVRVSMNDHRIKKLDSQYKKNYLL